MRVNAFSKKVAIGTIFCLLLASCTKEVFEPKTDPVTDPDPVPTPVIPGDSIFDFSMESVYDLNIKYDVPEGSVVKFYVYTENPLSVSEYGSISLKEGVSPVEAGFLDETGAYQHKIKLSSITDKLYIYTNYPSLPTLMTASVNGKTISDPVPVDLSEMVTTKSFRGATSLGGKLKDLHTLGRWDANGRPDYLLSEKIPISGEILNTINRILPDPNPTSEIGKYLIEGDIHVTENAHVNLYMISAVTSARSAFGYYCYPTGNPPKDVKEVKDIALIFPLAYVSENSLQRGEGISLHYYENGVDKGTEFPAGVSIGWVIYNNAFKDNNKLQNYAGSPMFSTSTLNKNKQKFMATFQVNGFVIMGFEDWTSTPRDYNDLVFHVESDPVDAITDEIPEVKPDEPKDQTVSVEYKGLLAYEDLWPRQGDFDMNDVIIRYNSKVTLNQKNQIVKLEDTYKLLWSGASIHNGFSYQLPGVSRTDIGVEGGTLDKSQRTAVIRVFDDALAENGNNSSTPEYTITTTFFGDGYEKDPSLLPPYNPFITTGTQDKEVHLTLYPPTEKAKKEYFGKDDDKSEYENGIYYVTYSTQNGQQMPYAIHIPGEVADFVVPAESKSIDSYYPGFLKWIETKGEQDKDWYLHPVGQNPEIPVE